MEFDGFRQRQAAQDFPRLMVRNDQNPGGYDSPPLLLLPQSYPCEGIGVSGSNAKRRAVLHDAAADYGAMVTILRAFEDARSSRTAVSAKPLEQKGSKRIEYHSLDFSAMCVPV
jgi:hypothetical protein